MAELGNLDAACPVCGVRAGSHTLDQQAVCLGTLTRDETYRDAPDGLVANVPAGTAMADHVEVKALVVHADGGVPAVSFDPRAGQIRVDVPAVFLEFGTSASGEVRPVARVLFVGTEDGVRGFGRLLRDTSNGAANAAKRAAERKPSELRDARWQR